MYSIGGSQGNDFSRSADRPFRRRSGPEQRATREINRLGEMEIESRLSAALDVLKSRQSH